MALGRKTVKPFASADKLSLDIFMGILEAVESKGDLLSFLLTCRTLYTQGKHLMLRNLRISASNLESFYAYMHSHVWSFFNYRAFAYVSVQRPKPRSRKTRETVGKAGYDRKSSRGESRGSRRKSDNAEQPLDAGVRSQ